LFGSDGNDYSVNLRILNVRDRAIAVSIEGTYSSLHSKSKNYWGFDVLFDTPVSLIKGARYVIGTTISGPDSFGGRNGKSLVVSSGVTFKFEGSSDVSTTGVKQGQLREIIFSLQG